MLLFQDKASWILKPCGWGWGFVGEVWIRRVLRFPPFFMNPDCALQCLIQRERELTKVSLTKISEMKTWLKQKGVYLGFFRTVFQKTDTRSRTFLGGPVGKTPCSMQHAQGSIADPKTSSHMPQLRFHMLQLRPGTAKKVNKINSWIFFKRFKTRLGCVLLTYTMEWGRLILQGYDYMSYLSRIIIGGGKK